MTLDEFIRELEGGARAVLLVRHAERPKMDPDDPTFGDGVALTEEGVRTSRELGRRLAGFRNDVRFLSSPLTRTRMTAALIAEGMGVEPFPEIVADGKLGNDSFYYEDPAEVLDVFRPENFFPACFEYFRTGRQRGFRELHEATDDLERWLEERFSARLVVVTTHDCYIAAFLSARGAVEEYTKDNWPRFLDCGAILVRPDGSRSYVPIRTGLSDGICGVRKPPVSLASFTMPVSI